MRVAEVLVDVTVAVVDVVDVVLDVVVVGVAVVMVYDKGHYNFTAVYCYCHDVPQF